MHRGASGGKAPSTLGTKDTVKNVAEAEDSLSEVETKNFQRLAGKMLHQCSGSKRRHGDIGLCKLIVGAMARLTWVIRQCIDKQMLSWGFNLDRLQQKLAVLVDGDHASGEARVRASRAITKPWSIA